MKVSKEQKHHQLIRTVVYNTCYKTYVMKTLTKENVAHL